jgi:hypothetical protein
MTAPPPSQDQLFVKVEALYEYKARTPGELALVARLAHLTPRDAIQPSCRLQREPL